jgi:membrane-associated HD superfamily phosphohydrolase
VCGWKNSNLKETGYKWLIIAAYLAWSELAGLEWNILCFRKNISTLECLSQYALVRNEFNWQFLTFRVNVFLFIAIVCFIRAMRKTKNSYRRLQTNWRMLLHKFKRKVMLWGRCTVTWLRKILLFRRRCGFILLFSGSDILKSYM